MYASLRSHCMQEYEEYEIIFGVSESADPAAKIVERLKLEFPQRAIRLLVCEKNLGSNTKVSNLAQMLPRSKYEYLLVNDSDIRVEPDYLRRVIAPFADTTVGMVTCLYRGVASSTLGSHLEMLRNQHRFLCWSTGGTSIGRRSPFCTRFYAGVPALGFGSRGRVRSVRGLPGGRLRDGNTNCRARPRGEVIGRCS